MRKKTQLQLPKARCDSFINALLSSAFSGHANQDTGDAVGLLNFYSLKFSSVKARRKHLECPLVGFYYTLILSM